MDLPVMPPVAPMLAKLAHELPTSEGVVYEPKWDGFRTIVFRDGDDVELGSRNERPMTRYFPELVGPIRDQLPPKCVIDGEIVVARGSHLDFDALLQRIHPAESRVTRLSEETPASFIAFDLLAMGERDLRSAPFSERRTLLEECLTEARSPLFITPATRDRGVALEWFNRFEGAGLDGVVVKTLDLAYREGERVMVKVKHERVADCVVGGFRWHKKGDVVGSLLLGLYDQEGTLHHVGVTSSFTMARRRELVDELEPYRRSDLSDHPWRDWSSPASAGGQRRPGATSRWNAKRDLSWEPLAPVLVCEVSYDHLQGDRFRHATTFKRWRPDRDPDSCTYDQLEEPGNYSLSEVLGGAQ
jgi:ATP-dependent DNA ligase